LIWGGGWRYDLMMGRDGAFFGVYVCLVDALDGSWVFEV